MSDRSLVTNNTQDTFTLFPNLPTELQLKIWKAAIPKPCTIPVNYRRITPTDFTFATNIEPSGMLGACKISREVIVKTFTASIKSPDGSIIRFDGENDVILLLAVSFGAHSRKRFYVGGDHSHQFSGIKNLAICFRPLSQGCFYSIGSLVSQFKGLEKFYIVNPGYNTRCCEDLCVGTGKLRVVPVQWRDYLAEMEQSGLEASTLEILERDMNEFVEEREDELEKYKEHFLPDWKVPEVSWMKLLTENDTLNRDDGKKSRDWHQNGVTYSRFDSRVSVEEMEHLLSQLRFCFQNVQ